MSTQRDWKPGDVALIQWKQFPEEPAMFWDGYWHDTGNATFHGRESDLKVRPLVVIDPEDRGTVLELLQRACLHPPGTSLTHYATRLQAALRSLIEPPKPEEPTGLGAVVERADGKRWVRGPKGHWTNLDATGSYLNWHLWQQVNEASPVVKVLSEGVQQ